MTAHAPRPVPATAPRRRALGALLVLTVSCGVAVSSVGLASPANASPYPSWAEVQAAKSNQAEAQKQAASINAAIKSLQSRATDAGTAASVAGEKYQIALADEQTAKSNLDSLKKEQAAAAKQAKLSQQRVGQLVAQLSHTGDGQLTVTLLTQSSKASNLLYQLGAMSNLTDRTTSLLQEARQDVKLVSSLRDQAVTAQSALDKQAGDAAAALKQANALAQTVTTAVANQQKNQSQLISQIAYLKGTTAAVESKYYDGVAATAAANAAAAAAATAAANAAKASPPATSTTSGSGSGGSTSGGGGGTTTPTTPPVTTTPPSSGSSSATTTAINFAKAQVGKPYVFDAAGPNAYDCSGLMMASYNAAGVYIGGHSVRLQWNYLGAEGRRLPLADRQPGDILFYYDPAADSMYHDAMYLGNGLMIEAPNPSAPVRIVAIRFTQLENEVGRPAG
ncbi:MAG: hypothetical protein JWP75_520 [Frondihabitans sp.]|nr:hypothetical protein [Frondihabitans sp.]